MCSAGTSKSLTSDSPRSASTGSVLSGSVLSGPASPGSVLSGSLLPGPARCPGVIGVIGVIGALPGTAGVIGFFGYSVAALAWVAFAFALGSWAQAVSGFGFALITIPLLTVVAPRTEAVIAQTIAGMVVTTWMAWKLRAEVDRPMFRRALPMMLVGLPVGIVVGHVLPERIMRFVIGVSVIAAATGFALGVQLRGRVRVVDAVAGFVSGVLSTTTGTTGPPLVIAMTGRSMAPAASRATLQALFTFANISAIGLFVVDGSFTREGVALGLLGLGPATLVRRAGERSFQRLDPARYRTLVLVLLVLAGSIAIWRALQP